MSSQQNHSWFVMCLHNVKATKFGRTMIFTANDRNVYHCVCVCVCVPSLREYCTANRYDKRETANKTFISK